MKPKKGLWFPDEDQKLRDYKMNYAHGCWSELPINSGLVCKDEISNGLAYQNAPVNGLLSNEGSTDSSETVNRLNKYSNEDMFHTEMKFDQIFNFNGGDFNIEDFLYI
ncbi:transcription factor LAF1-like protein [Tanacetum coccineum]